MLFPGWPWGHSFFKSSNPGVQQILHCYVELQEVQVQPSHFMWVNRDKFPGLLWLCDAYLILHPGLQGRMVPVPCYTCTCALLGPQRSGIPAGHDAFGVKHLFLCPPTPGAIGLNVEHCIWACPLPGSYLPQFLENSGFKSTNTMYSPIWFFRSAQLSSHLDLRWDPALASPNIRRTWSCWSKF